VYSIAWFATPQAPEWIQGGFQRIGLMKNVNISWPTRSSISAIPGEPENSDRAGTTVFGGRIVLSAIFAQSLMIVNLP
jgi:hypothetical protein